MKLKVLQWNIWRKEDPRKIVNEVSRINPDIFCVQELYQNTNTGTDTASEIFNLLHRKYNFFYKEAATWDNRPDVTSQGNAIFTKFPIRKSNFTFIRAFTHNPKKATKEGRVYIEVEIKIGSGIVTVGTVHLPYSYKLRNTKVRKDEADRLCSVLKNKTKNFVFCGDLNSTPRSYTVLDILKNTDLAHAGPDFDFKTWPTKPFNYHGFKVDNLTYRVDYVFVSKDVATVNSEIVKTEFSDHLPILTEIEV